MHCIPVLETRARCDEGLIKLNSTLACIPVKSQRCTVQLKHFMVEVTGGCLNEQRRCGDESRLNGIYSRSFGRAIAR